jgi:DNA-binding response OmpR family regulator
MATILIVDDDRNFLLSLADGLRSLEEDLEILTAPNGEEAVKLLESSGIDLIVSDIKMPKMDGFELLSYVSRNYPSLPVIIITAFGTPEIETNMSNMGSFQYLEKPLDFNVLIESIYTGLEAKSSGYLKGISLASFLQLVEMEKKTCTLKIKEGDKTGVLYFKKGELLDAETGELDGEEAALSIISWESATIEIDWKTPKKSKKTVNPLSAIIVEAFSKKDENKRDEPLELDISYAEETVSSVDLDRLDHTQTSKQKPKEGIMNIQKLNEAIETLKKDLGDGLLASDIWMSQDGQSIAAYNSRPEATALFNELTTHMNKTLKGAGFPILGRFYLLDLADKQMVIVIPMGDYGWGMLVDGHKSQLGLLLNVALPHAIDVFEEAIAG